eukprot:942324-Prymnesium_polylepis.2
MPLARKLAAHLQIYGEEIPARAEFGSNLPPARIYDRPRNLSAATPAGPCRHRRAPGPRWPIVPQSEVMQIIRTLAHEGDEYAVLARLPDHLAQQFHIPEPPKSKRERTVCDSTRLSNGWCAAHTPQHSHITHTALPETCPTCRGAR